MNIIIRLIWFFIIGWELGLIWFFLCLILILTIIFLPIGAYAITKTWAIMTLSSNPKKIIVEVREYKKEN